MDSDSAIPVVDDSTLTYTTGTHNQPRNVSIHQQGKSIIHKGKTSKACGASSRPCKKSSSAANPNLRIPRIYELPIFALQVLTHVPNVISIAIPAPRLWYQEITKSITDPVLVLVRKAVDELVGVTDNTLGLGLGSGTKMRRDGRPEENMLKELDDGQERVGAVEL